MGKAAAGFGGQMFHDSQLNYFTGIEPRERIIAVWNGQAHTQPGCTAGAVLVALYAPEGSLVYRAWLCSTALACPQLAQSNYRVLSFDPTQGPQFWALVNHGAPQI